MKLKTKIICSVNPYISSAEKCINNCTLCHLPIALKSELLKEKKIYDHIFSTTQILAECPYRLQFYKKRKYIPINPLYLLAFSGTIAHKGMETIFTDKNKYITEKTLYKIFYIEDKKIMLIGKVDLIEILNENQAIIYDFKFSTKDSYSDYNIYQLNIYRYLLEQTSNLKVIKMINIFLRNTNNPTIIVPFVENIEKFIKEKLLVFKRAINFENFEYNDLKFCNYCLFNKDCAVYKK